MMTSRSSIVSNDTTSRLLVGIASFASPLTNYIYGRRVVVSYGRRTTIILEARKSGPRVTSRVRMKGQVCCKTFRVTHDNNY